MREYMIKKITLAFVTLVIVMILNFLIFRVWVGGDPSQLIMDPSWDKDVRESLRQAWGLDAPLFPDQFLAYMYNLFTWNYGYAFDEQRTPIAPVMAWRLRNTVMLMGLATIGTIAIGIPIGVLAASRRGKKLDATVIGVGLFTWGVPTFFIQLLFLLVFTTYWHQWFGYTLIPVAGIVSIIPSKEPLAFAADVAWHLIGPVTTLMIAGFGSWALYTRNMLVDALTEDYILTARAKGVTNRNILYKHAFRSILPPIVTMMALAIPGIVTGAIITETIFSYPGIGLWYINALNNNNHPVAQAVLYNYALLMIFANLIVDIAYGFLDPRIRVGVRR